MRTAIIALIALLLSLGASMAEPRLIIKKSESSVKTTLDRLEKSLRAKGITIFARVDHASGAKKSGQSLPPTQVLIFGNPKIGTPLMLSNRKIGLDLPMKVLCWKDADGNVMLAYLDPTDLKERYGIDDKDEVFEKMAGALTAFTAGAIAKPVIKKSKSKPKKKRIRKRKVQKPKKTPRGSY